MKKYLTRIETSVGYETYRLVIESERPMTYNSIYYYIENASIISVKTVHSNASLKDGPFKKGFFNFLKFPIVTTLMSQQLFEYGDIETTQ